MKCMLTKKHLTHKNVRKKCPLRLPSQMSDYINVSIVSDHLRPSGLELNFLCVSFLSLGLYCGCELSSESEPRNTTL